MNVIFWGIWHGSSLELLIDGNGTDAVSYVFAPGGCRGAFTESNGNYGIKILIHLHVRWSGRKKCWSSWISKVTMYFVKAKRHPWKLPYTHVVSLVVLRKRCDIMLWLNSKFQGRNSNEEVFGGGSRQGCGVITINTSNTKKIYCEYSARTNVCKEQNWKS